MKKTTKILLVLAAVVAMTIGAVSTVMAADVVIDPATWDCTDGWYAKDTNGNEIKNGWAVDPDGHWYYFYDGKALENEFLFWQGETYYFGGDCIMCEGWVKFLANEERNVAAIDSLNQVTCADEVLLDGDSKNPYGKAVWCYFAKGGAAASNEWIEDQGLWYYFEGEIMVSNNYMYQPAGEDVFYGFSGDGNMHVGWIKAGRAFDKEKPYDNDLSCWLYYNTDGSMANLGWKKIDNVWYYFVANTNHAYATEAYDVPVNAAVLLTNYFGTLDNGTKNFYLDTTGAMKTGAVTINSGVRTRTSVADCLNAGSGSKVDGRNRTFKFNSDGQKLGADGNNYYLQATDTSVFDVYNTDDKEAVVVTATTKCSTTMPGGLSAKSDNGVPPFDRRYVLFCREVRL